MAVIIKHISGVHPFQRSIWFFSSDGKANTKEMMKRMKENNTITLIRYFEFCEAWVYLMVSEWYNFTKINFGVY